VVIKSEEQGDTCPLSFEENVITVLAFSTYHSSAWDTMLTMSVVNQVSYMDVRRAEKFSVSQHRGKLKGCIYGEFDLGRGLGWPGNHECDKQNRIEDILQLDPIIPFNNIVMEAYWLILSSAFGAIKLNSNIESDRHSPQTNNDILSSDTCEMIAILPREQIYGGTYT